MIWQEQTTDYNKSIINMFDFRAVVKSFARVYRVWYLVPIISNVQMMITDMLYFPHFVSTGYEAVKYSVS